MVFGSFNTALAFTGLCFFFALVIDAAQDKDCVCLGPTKYYEELRCLPVFKKPEDCCPIRYNCDVWINLPDDKCFVNGHTYEWGELLREEDSNPCDDCRCGGEDTPSGKDSRFSCVSTICEVPRFPDDSKCYWRQNATDCCGGDTYCLKQNEVRPTCIVDGKTYKDGDRFVPSAEPEKKCICGDGYTGIDQSWAKAISTCNLY